MARGYFISFEGGEGVGKSTQIARIAELLEARGADVVVTREPGGSPGAEDIRALLLGGEPGRWSAPSEALLFAAARGNHVDSVIRPALKRGAWVLCDRYVDSSRAYQGRAGGLGDAAILALHAIGSGGLMPDRTILLDMEDADAARRAGRRDQGAGDRFEQKDARYHGDVRYSFRVIAGEEPGRFRIIDSSRPKPEVTEAIVAALGGWWPE